jgi:hypothetical protein
MPTDSTPDRDDFDLDAASERRSELAGTTSRHARPMSRRHHGGRPHRPGGHARQPSAPLAAPAESERPRQDPSVARIEPATEEATAVAPASATIEAASFDAPLDVAPPAQLNGHDLPDRIDRGPALHPSNGNANGNGMPASAGCTAPQLRRFIKSRPYVPMHELRRRFGINGQEDDVTAVDLSSGRVFVGLPAREGGLLGELLRGGEVGYELSMDPRSPIVVGLYPMRPVPRP